MLRSPRTMSRLLAVPLALTLTLAVVMLVGWSTAFSTQAHAETRTLKMYFTHTRESATITFKKNGKYIPSGLRKANRFLRDWRRKEPTKMDPALLDLVWEIYQQTGSSKPIHVISGYRSPRTNNMLRRRGRNVAKTSQHTRGKALDFMIPGVPVAKLRALGLKAHRGGVGYYRGGFVHVDTGRVRHWPRMSRKQLARVFPRGRTIHVPSNGKPLRGYKTAAANLKKGLNADGSRRKTVVKRSLLARIFAPGPDGDEDEGAADSKPVKKAPAAKPKPKPVAVAAARPPALAPNAAANDPFATRPAPTPSRKPVEAVALANSEPESTAQRAAAALADGAAVEAQPETITLAEMPRARLPVPRFLPRAPIPQPEPAPETVVAALAPQDNQSVLQRATSVVYGTPTDIAANLRPRVDVPGGPASVTPAQPKPEPIIRTAALPPQLAPASVPLPEPTVSDAPGALSTTAARQPMPEMPETSEDVAALKERITAALSRGPSTTIARAAKMQKEALEKPQQIASLADRAAETLSRPSTRPATSQSAITKPRRAKRAVPLPDKPVIATRAITRVAGGAPAKAELALGDLDGRDVKVWAVVKSTRIGPVATLKAPDYSKGPRRVLPATVYSAGFASGKRIKRSTGFNGTAPTRLAFADLNR